MNGAVEEIYSPAKFPDDGTVETGARTVGRHRAHHAARIRGRHLAVALRSRSESRGYADLPDGKIEITAEMPLRELMRGFFDKLKSISSGYASLSYEFIGMRQADVVRLDMLVAEEPVPAFARIVRAPRADEAEQIVEKLEGLLPKQLFELKIQAKSERPHHRLAPQSPRCARTSPATSTAATSRAR